MEAVGDLNLPAGFRFHPTDEELVVDYLARKAAARPFRRGIITEVDLYKFDPWELPAKAAYGEGEWYFFSPRDRKYPNGARPNRAAGSGYWKATGTDKPVLSGGTKVGVKKALVFYRGRAPKGVKTSWIMHEYRLAAPISIANAAGSGRKSSLRLDDWVLCRIYKKGVKASPVALPPAPPTETKLGADDQSCLEEALAWLPDIEPRMESFGSMLSGQPQQPSWSPGNGSGSSTEPGAVVINNRIPLMNMRSLLLQRQVDAQSRQLARMQPG